MVIQGELFLHKETGQNFQYNNVTTEWRQDYIGHWGYVIDKFGLNNWIFLTGVINSSRIMDIYVNGTKHGSTSRTNYGNCGSHGVAVGYSNREGINAGEILTNKIKMAVAELRIYNRSLSAAEVKEIYDSIK